MNMYVFVNEQETDVDYGTEAEVIATIASNLPEAMRNCGVEKCFTREDFENADRHQRKNASIYFVVNEHQTFGAKYKWMFGDFVKDIHHIDTSFEMNVFDNQ
jgi:hypothetical protein